MAMDSSWIKSEAIKLIETHVDLSEALGELMLGQGENVSGRQSDWQDALQLAEAIDVSPSLLSTQQLAVKIVAGQVSGQVAVDTAELLQVQGLLEPRLFVSTLMKSLSKIPLQVTCQLLRSEHISFWHVHSQCGKNGVAELIQRMFSCSDITQPLLQDLSRLVVTTLYSLSTNQQTSTPLTTELIVTVLKHQYCSSEREESSYTYTLLDAVQQCNSIPGSTLKQFYYDILAHFLSSSSSKLSYCDIIPCQDNWRSSNLPEIQCKLYTTILDQVDHGGVIQCLDRAVAYSSDEVNWDVVLPVVVCYITSSHASANQFRDYVSQLVAQATTSGEGYLLYVALILARQAALEGAHVHPPYQKWFQEHFGSRRPTRKILHFLVRQLTSLLPFEPACCLKAHIQALPRLSTAQEIVGDYIQLAQVRLSELKESATTPTPNADTSDVEYVKEMVEAYNSSGNIPNQVLQTRLFRPPYYTRVFLRTLLSPSLPKTINPSGLIDALAKENKIPQSMLNAYNPSSADTDPNFLTSLPPAYERIGALMQRLVDAIQKGDFADRGTRLLSKLSHTLSDAQLPPCGSKQLNWQCPDIPPDLIQLADLLVNSLSSMVLLEVDYQPACQHLLLMLDAFPSLLKALLARLWELVHCQITDLNATQLKGVARLCHQLWLSTSPISHHHFYLHHHTLKLKNLSDYCALLMGQLPHTTSLQMTSAVDFCSEFIMCSLKLSEQQKQQQQQWLGPPLLLAKLKYLSTRSSMLVERCSKVVCELNHQSEWTTVHVDFVEWLEWELEVREDPLPDWERERYHQNMFFQEFLTSCTGSHHGEVKDQGDIHDDGGGGHLTVEDALCQFYTTLSLHHTAPSFTKLIPLLQNVCNCLPAAKGTPYLLKALDQALDAAIGHGDGYHVAVIERQANPLRLLTHLPSYLLFTNCLPSDRTSISSALADVTRCLKKILVQVGDVVLDTGLTNYLCKGVFALERTTSDSTLCQQLIHCSPIFSASLACSWLKLEHLFPTWNTSHAADLSSWLNSCCEGGEIPSPPPHLPHTVLAACLVKRHMTNHIPQLKPVLQVLPVEVTMVMVDFALRLLAPPLHAPSHQRLMDLIKLCCDVYQPSLGVCSTNTDLILQHSGTIQSSREEFPFHCGCGLQYLPVVFFNILQSSNADMFMEPSLVEYLLPVVLSSHKHCLDLASSSRTYQVLENDFMEKSIRLVKRFIEASPTAVLQRWVHLSHSSLNPYIKLLISSTSYS